MHPTRIVIYVFVLMLSAGVLNAQDDGDTGTGENIVTQDDVNEIASEMFCPICENEPLDTCRATTCQMWRSEIRDMLTQGMSEDEIIGDFIDRFGQRVVGVPEDDGLRLLSFIAPIVVAIFALVVGVMTFSRWQQNQRPEMQTAATSGTDNDVVDDYRARLEADLNE